MIAPRGASALLVALSLSGCAGIISPAAERGRAPAAPAATVIPDDALPPLPSADYRYEPNPIPSVRQRAAPAEGNAAGAAYSSGPPVADLPLTEASAARAFHAFRVSCPIAINRGDRTGLVSSADWVEPCRAAAAWRGDPRRFFAEQFETVRVGDGQAFATGYYDPEIAASRDRSPGYDHPIYGRPDDLLMRELPRNAEPDPLPEGVRMVDGEMLPYFDRAAIEAGALEGRGLEIAWARDPVELFFFHVQGGGLLRLDDGSLARLSYSGTNGHPYRSIGALMRERDLLEPGAATAQDIQDWLRANPEAGRALMNENPRYVFFAQSSSLFANGALATAVTPRASVAVDFDYVPPGAPVFLDLDQDEGDGLWVAQDTGGAIRGANRFDTFWGAGEEARRIAGAMSARGEALILLPRTATRRLHGN